MNTSTMGTSGMTGAATTHREPPKPFWNPLVAGIALGLVLFASFAFTGQGLGATGFITRVTAQLTSGIDALQGPKSYLGPLVESGIFSAWISWQAVGLMIGALVAGFLARRIRIQIDGQKTLGAPRRLAMALIGGLVAGLGARISQGCTSGLGLSGSATLGIAGFTFLAAFFVTGLIVSRLVKGVQG